jgi:hypothetical protein
MCAACKIKERETFFIIIDNKTFFFQLRNPALHFYQDFTSSLGFYSPKNRHFARGTQHGNCEICKIKEVSQNSCKMVQFIK